jgi:hypothetical protein
MAFQLIPLSAGETKAFWETVEHALFDSGTKEMGRRHRDALLKSFDRLQLTAPTNYLNGRKKVGSSFSLLELNCFYPAKYSEASV